MEAAEMIHVPNDCMKSLRLGKALSQPENLSQGGEAVAPGETAHPPTYIKDRERVRQVSCLREC